MTDEEEGMDTGVELRYDGWRGKIDSSRLFGMTEEKAWPFDRLRVTEGLVSV